MHSTRKRWLPRFRHVMFLCLVCGISPPVCLPLASWAVTAAQAATGTDWRRIQNGSEIPTETYADQPYIVKADDGAWVCALTTGKGREGQVGQHVVSMRSSDRGQTWSPPVDVEPADGPEASYSVLLKVPSGRIYCFYNHNSDNLREALADDPPFKGGRCRRVDSLGYYVFKFSDDHGRSWSKKRYPVDVRAMEIDRQNPYHGTVRFFWNVGKPFIYDRVAYVSLHKVGGLGRGFFTRSEGVLLASANLPAEPDPEKIVWQTLPDGQIGLRTPPGGGPVAEEQSYSVLSDGSFYAVYRSIDGHPVFAYSRDAGHSWSEPRYLRFADGRLMKHPRAANFAWKCANGKYLYWWHNHGGRFIRDHPSAASFAYNDRNPAWLSGGVEVDSPQGRVIQWSQPEIVLYDDDPFVRMSYPDLIEDGGEYYLSETQKERARVHAIPAAFLDALWGQFELQDVAARDLILELPEAGQPLPRTAAMPKLADFVRRENRRANYGTRDLRTGFTLGLWVRFDDLAPGQVVLDSRSPGGAGLALVTTRCATVQIVLDDGRTECRWDCDRGVLQAGKLHHVAVIVDGGPKIISFVVDGKFNDGGDDRQFGWGRFNPNLRNAGGSGKLRIGPALRGEVKRLRVYRRALMVTEAVGNFRVGP